MSYIKTKITLGLVFSGALFCTSLFAEPANLGQLKAQLIQYHDSGRYQKEIAHIARKAIQYIHQQVQQNKTLQTPKKLALVLDIDETSLSNYNNMRKLDFANLPEQIKQQLRAADEPAIQPILKLYREALQEHVAVFFITGREEALKEATIQNLHHAGYTSWSGLSLNRDRSPTITYKTAARAKISQQGYTIIASIGDQNSDFPGGYAQRTFKLPNPYYYIP